MGTNWSSPMSKSKRRNMWRRKNNQLLLKDFSRYSKKSLKSPSWGGTRLNCRRCASNNSLFPNGKRIRCSSVFQSETLDRCLTVEKAESDTLVSLLGTPFDDGDEKINQFTSSKDSLGVVQPVASHFFCLNPPKTRIKFRQCWFWYAKIHVRFRVWISRTKE